MIFSHVPGCVRSWAGCVAVPGEPSPAGRVPGAVGELGRGQPGRVSVENSAKIKKKFGEDGDHFFKFPITFS